MPVLAPTPVLTPAKSRRRRLTDTEVKSIASSRARVADWVRSTAAERGISYVPTATDLFAHDVSRLADAGADLDEVESLLLAVRRTGLLSSSQRLQLHGAYLTDGRRAL